MATGCWELGGYLSSCFCNVILDVRKFEPKEVKEAGLSIMNYS